MKNRLSVTVLGAGNMGTALAQIIAKNGYQVTIWSRAIDAITLDQIKNNRENTKYLPGVKLSKNITTQTNLALAVTGAQIVFFVIPSSQMAGLIKKIVKYLPCGVVCVDASKGLDEKSLWLITDIMGKYMPSCLRSATVSISGPAIATDMVREGFTAMNISSKNNSAIALVKRVLENENLKLFSMNDVVGVEVAGSFKNVYAIAMGICDGLAYPMNTKAALLVFAIKEISRLIKKMGGKEETVYDLAGLGDLVGTGLCVSSRNRQFGEYLAKGRNRSSALKKIGQVVEGAGASRLLVLLGTKYRISLPFANMIYRIVWKNSDPAKAMKEYLDQLS